MSVQGEIDRIITAVGNAYSKVSEKGGTAPSSQTVANLATAIDSIPSGVGDMLASTYDPQGKAQDIFAYADAKSNKAVAFTVTLSSSGWSGKAQTVSDARFLTGNYAYSVAPDSGSFAAYGESIIYADNVTTAGKMQFHCGEVPTAALTVNILRMEASA